MNSFPKTHLSSSFGCQGPTSCGLVSVGRESALHELIEAQRLGDSVGQTEHARYVEPFIGLLCAHGGDVRDAAKREPTRLAGIQEISELIHEVHAKQDRGFV